MSVVSKLQFTHASRSSRSWLSKQPKLGQSSKLVVASLSCAELGTAQPQLVFYTIVNKYSHVTFVSDEVNHFGAHKGKKNPNSMLIHSSFGFAARISRPYTAKPLYQLQRWCCTQL